MKPTDFVSQFQCAVREVANKQKMGAYKITEKSFLRYNTHNITLGMLNEHGGYNQLKRLCFLADENVINKHGSRMLLNYREKLDRAYGQTVFTQNSFLEAFTKILENYPIKLHKYLPKKGAKVPKEKSRTLISNWSDLHFGAEITKEETVLNEWNWDVAAERTSLYVEQLIKYKAEYRKETELVIALNGDILQGVIHDQEWFAHLLTLQFAGALHTLGQAFSYLSAYFPKIRIMCASGNHGRAMHKGVKGRAVANKFDGYEGMFYIALKEALKSCDNISVDIPKTPYCLFEANGHLYFQTHGDTVFEIGNIGHVLNTKSIVEHINKINASDIVPEGRKVKAVLLGHVHTATVQETDSGCYLIVNGCMNGSDPYAQSIGIFGNNATQIIFEATAEYPVGDIRFIKLNAADAKKNLSKIIVPFKGKL